MSTIIQAKKFVKKIQQEVWQPYSTSGFEKHYSKAVRGHSGNCSLSFDEVYEYLKISRERFSYLQPDIHHVTLNENGLIIAHLTSINFDHYGKEALRINTMVTYKVKEDKITAVEFLWDKAIEVVMGHSMSQILPSSKANGATDLEKQLTKRELQCLFHLLQGRSAKQIAYALKLSNRTVESYLINIRHKLNLANSRELLDYAYAHGLVSFSPLFSELLDECLQ